MEWVHIVSLFYNFQELSSRFWYNENTENCWCYLLVYIVQYSKIRQLHNFNNISGKHNFPSMKNIYIIKN